MIGYRIGRRQLMACAYGCALTASAAPWPWPSAWAAEGATPALTPDEALARLKEGNSNFVMEAP